MQSHLQNPSTLIFQIESLKDVISLTKDMLTIREVEVRDLTERMESMDVKFKAEKDRKALMMKKMELADQLNADLKAEYKAQKEIFNVSLFYSFQLFSKFRIIVCLLDIERSV